MDFEPLDQYFGRQKKLKEITALGYPAYPHKFNATHTLRQVLEQWGPCGTQQLLEKPVSVRVAGRIVALRPHGKAAFAHLAAEGARLQVYVKLDVVGEKAFRLFELLDLGDIIGVSGQLFRTKTNELTVRVEGLELLTKALLPLPEKWHGLADVETRYRRRYLDLLVNERAREIFVRRTQIIRELRRFLDQRGYLEVETPMMHPILGGATALPFITHHNRFDMDLYLRIAPELYLKRLVVGGFDRLYEINRNFRNEGIDAIHQPEFTMLEFYQAYSDAAELMELTEELLRGWFKASREAPKSNMGKRRSILGISNNSRCARRSADIGPRRRGHDRLRPNSAARTGPERSESVTTNGHGLMVPSPSAWGSVLTASLPESCLKPWPSGISTNPHSSTISRPRYPLLQNPAKRIPRSPSDSSCLSREWRSRTDFPS